MLKILFLGYLHSLNKPFNILDYEEFDFVQNDQPYNDILPLDVDVTQYLAQDTGSKKKVQFSLDFKLKGIEEAKRTSNGEFARKYGIDRTVITRWRQSEAKLRRAKANGGQFRAKGQLISKCRFGIFNSPKKRTIKFDFTTMYQGMR